jgi:DNA-binding Lrp family transcriptional regulator
LTPSEALAEAVLRQAVQDLFVKAAATASGASDANPTSDGKLEAVRFLADQSGAFAESRAFWCLAAGKNPDRLRQTIIAVLEGDDRLLDAYPGSKFDRVAAITETRALYRARKLEVEGAKVAWLEAAERRKARLKASLERQSQLDAIRREKGERRYAEALYRDGKPSKVLDAEIARVVNALKDGPLLISRVSHNLCLTYEATRNRLEEAARRGLVERIGKGLWQLAPASVQAAPQLAVAASG